MHKKVLRNSSETEDYLFPGTGFFVKNRKPYDDYEAKSWFKEAFDSESKVILTKHYHFMKSLLKDARMLSSKSMALNGK